ncbi:MAG: nickel-binding protein, partial [Kofleriaceae bacterium]
MPRYLVIHHAPGVTAEDFQRSVPAVLENKYATFVQVYANLVDGLIVNLYDGDDEAAVARELERIGFPFDEIKELQFAAS